MCQTFFFDDHENCKCIHIMQVFTPCAAYSRGRPKGTFWMPNPFAAPKKPSTGPDPFADPEGEPSLEPDPFADPEEETSAASDPFADPETPIADPDPEDNYVALGPNPKILTAAYSGLNFAYKDIDVVSTDVDDTKAPKGLKCPGGITAEQIYRFGRESNKPCMLCDRPEVLGIVEEMVKWREEGKAKGEGKGKGQKKGIFHKTAQMGTAAVKSLKSSASSKAKMPEDGSGEDWATGQEEKPKRGWVQRLKVLLEDPENTMYRDVRGEPIPPFC